MYELIEGTVATGEGALLIGGTPLSTLTAATAPGTIKAQKGKKEKISVKTSAMPAEDARSSSPHPLDLLSDADKSVDNNGANLIDIEDSSSDTETGVGKRKKVCCSNEASLLASFFANIVFI